MTSCDALIVGGGPAGSSVARKLRRGGLDVVLIDRRPFPRHKVCAGWITPPVVEALALDLEEYARGRTLQPIHGFQVGMLGARHTLTWSYTEPVSWGIRRCEFDDYLLRRSGAELRLGTPLRTLKRAGGAWLANETLRARLVVGAGGHFCPVARRNGAARSGETVVVAQEIEFAMTADQERACPVDPLVPELYFCRDLRGYGWVFRKGAYLNVGLGREDGLDLPRHVKSFREQLVARGRIPVDTPTRFHGHAYLLYGTARRPLVGDGLMLVGDAAGLAYPQSGEGIRPAVESGLMAAEVALATTGDFDRAALAPYESRIVDRYGSRGRPRAGASVGPPGAIKRALAARLLATEWFVRRIVLERWFLHRHEPRAFTA